MGARLQRLLNELQDRGGNAHLRCSHGGVLYPLAWNTKTREAAVTRGDLIVCSCKPPKRADYGWIYLITPSSV